MQSKKHSILESVLNTASGFVVAFIVWRTVVAPMFGLPIDVQTNLAITGIFTVTSIIRGYLWRRLFNWLHVRNIL